MDATVDATVDAIVSATVSLIMSAQLGRSVCVYVCELITLTLWVDPFSVGPSSEWVDPFVNGSAHSRMGNGGERVRTVTLSRLREL